MKNHQSPDILTAWTRANSLLALKTTVKIYLKTAIKLHRWKDVDTVILAADLVAYLVGISFSDLKFMRRVVKWIMNQGDLLY